MIEINLKYVIMFGPIVLIWIFIIGYIIGQIHKKSHIANIMEYTKMKYFRAMETTSASDGQNEFLKAVLRRFVNDIKEDKK